jgi:hypothetical protein
MNKLVVITSNFPFLTGNHAVMIELPSVGGIEKNENQSKIG